MITQQTRAEQAVAELLEGLGLDPASERLRDTPRRVVATLRALIEREPMPPVTFLPGEDYNGVVELRDIPFHSLCEHHLLPFRGVAHISYLPGDRVVGISTLPRVVDHFAHGLQMQERLTEDIAGWLDAELEPRSLEVVLEAEHLCMSLRGIGSPGTRLTTRSTRGGEGKQVAWSIS